MKQKIFFLLVVVMAVGLFGTNLLMGFPQDVTDRDDYGILIIRIVDEDTGEPVREIFTVSFFDCSVESSPKYEWYEDTNNTGYLKRKLEPGLYCMRFSPDLNGSIYCPDPCPEMNPDKRQLIKIEKGKITEIIKKAKHGGYIKVKLVDQNGTAIDPKIEFHEDAKVDIGYKTDLVDMSATSLKTLSRIEKPELGIGEFILGSLHPEKADVYIIFDRMGFPRIKKVGIEIIKDETYEITVVLNKNERVSIEGNVVDEKGNPVKNAKLWVYGGPSIADVSTGSDGEFKFRGLAEGIYKLNLLIDFDDHGFYADSIYDINVKENVVIRKVFNVKLGRD